MQSTPHPAPVVPVYPAEAVKPSPVLMQQQPQPPPSNFGQPPIAPQVTTLLVTESASNGTMDALGIIGGKISKGLGLCTETRKNMNLPYSIPMY